VEKSSVRAFIFYNRLMAEQKIRATPRISVNKLAEYMVATPARRRGIIRDQKVVRDFVVARYQAVYGGIAEALVTHDVGPLYNRLERLYTASPASTWELQDNQLSVEALELFLQVFDELDLSRYSVDRPIQSLPKMNVSGTEVSVKPCVILREAGGVAAVGAVHIYLSKLFSFGDEAGAYATTVVHQYVENHLAEAKVRSSDSYVVDVFARRIHAGPKSFKRRRNDIAAACEEIAQRWSAV
jgi:hypothetical protein